MAASEGLRFLSLYKQILRLHQRKLPEVPRALGDRYVKQEFRAHVRATPEQVKEFMLQWTDYASHLHAEADLFGIGRDLPQDYIDSMNEQQQEQLQKIYNTAVKVSEESGSEPEKK